MAILGERCCIHREFVFHLQDAFRLHAEALLGFLLAAFEILWLLLGRPEESAESRMGSLFRTPYFLCVFVNVPKRKRSIVLFEYNRQYGLECFILLDLGISSTKISPETWSDRLISQIDPPNVKMTTNYPTVCLLPAFRSSHTRLKW